MEIRHKLPKRRMQLTLLLVIVMAFMPLQAAGAQSPYPNGIIPAGETVLGSQFIFAPRISIEGTVDGDVFAFGQDVSLTGEVKGSLFVLSTTATIDGLLEGDLFAANTRLTLGEESSIGRSAYVLAGLVNMLPGSAIGRDLYLVGLGGELSGTVGRYQRAHLGILAILEILLDEDGLLRPLLPDNFQLPWSLSNNLAGQLSGRLFHLSAPVSALGLSAMGLPMILQPPAQIPPVDSAAVGSWLLERLRTFAPLFLIGLLLLWLFPRFLQGSTGRLRAHPLKSFGTGVVAFFVGFGVAVLALALIVALGLFFAVIGFWDLALVIWGAGMGALSLAFSFFMLALGYLSKIIVAFLVGAILLGWLPGAFWGRRFWMLLLGLILVVLLVAIPFLGWVISMLIVLFGLGAIYLQLSQRGQPAEEPKKDLTVSPTVEEGEAQVQLAAEEPVEAGLTIEPEAVQVEEELAEQMTAEQVPAEIIEAPPAVEELVEAAPEEAIPPAAEILPDTSAMAEESGEIPPEEPPAA